MVEDSIIKIGNAAGVIYHFLENGECNLSRLKQHLFAKGYDSNTYLMAIGWLAREGKINISKTNNKWSISLR
ncbi:hypothetical protein J2755_001635 [Methanohalophilus levihalophilus]|uniref:winged helix-turn-helix domain-containing protein n=1 Tax=Methanohalophilus levihalophilus TaxID=1431282 RepID=UPI001AE9D3F2|nr:winged helix-turn-helix domain-containing protein [Methanohalophilus levihalophilus]MBP2030687.1 hypothetical protein [Methanohalophilus levihalophilus]